MHPFVHTPTCHVLLLGTIESRTHTCTPCTSYSHMTNLHMQELPNVVQRVLAQELLLA